VTETEWLTCNDPERMLAFLGVNVNTRKLRLFCCASCRRCWPFLDERSRRAISMGEQDAENAIDGVEVKAAVSAAHQAEADAYTAAAGDEDDIRYLAACAASDSINDPQDSATFVVRIATGASKLLLNSGRANHDGPPLSTLLRDIIGNPFRPATVDPVWLRWNYGCVVELARAIYDERAFDHLPILADALEDAGCDNADILAHCRGDGPHVRGCWVVDLLLGKS
jgi:hypothetical protein